MKYSTQTTRYEMGAVFACVDYFRHETHSSGLVVSPHLGRTVIVGGDPEFGLLSARSLEELKRMVRCATSFNPAQLGKEINLDELIESSLDTWRELLDDTHPLRVETLLSEIRTPNEQITPRGLVIPGQAYIPNEYNTTKGNEFVGYVALPEEIAIIERISESVQSLTTQSDGQNLGTHL
jgi:hypothetical protein